MIAHVYPIKRLPRSFSFFTYNIEQGASIKPGMFVKISFRKETLWGLVKSIQQTSPSSLFKTLGSTFPDLRLTPTEMAFYEQLAQETLQSVSSLLYAVFPSLEQLTVSPPSFASTSLSIRFSETGFLQTALQKISQTKTGFLSCLDLQQMTAVVLRYVYEHPNHQIAIFVPTVQETKQLAPFFSCFGLSLITGEESAKHRFVNWLAYRTKKNRVLLGTRLAALFPPEQTDTVFVLSSGNDQLKQTQKNPRYDVRWIALFFATSGNGHTYFLDVLPKIDDLLFFQKSCFFPPKNSFSVVIAQKYQGTQTRAHPLISYQADQLIESTLQQGKKVWCFYNKKGSGRSLVCQDCGRQFLCKHCGGLFASYETSLRCHHCATIEPLPISCPACKGSHLLEKGYGNRTVRRILQKLYPKHTVGLIEKNTVDQKEADILVFTSSFFEKEYSPFDPPKNVGALIHMDADLLLTQPHFRATEQAVTFCFFLWGVAKRCSATFLMQTQIPDIFSSYLFQPQICFQKDLQTRKDFRLPPFSFVIQIFYRSTETRISEIALKKLQKELQQQYVLLETVRIKKDTKQKFFLELRVSSEEKKQLFSYLSKLPDRFIIDMSALF